MASIVRWSLRYRLLVIGLAVGLTAFGVAQLRGNQIDVLPEYLPPYVEIQTEALGLSAGEVEQFITVPMEANLLAGVAWVESIRSESVPGLSSIVLLFEPGTDLLRARQMVQERLTQAHALPRVSKPPQMIQPLSAASRVMMIGLSSSEHSLIDLSVLARWTVRPRLMGVPGVANVAIWGQREKQLQVQVDPEQLAARGVTLDQIIRTAGNALWVSPLSYLNASTPGSGGFIDTPNQRLGIRHVLPIRTPDDLERVPIEGAANQRLGDVTTVKEDHQPLIGDASTDDGDALLLIIEKLPGANTLDVTSGVESALAAMQPGLPGVAVDTGIYRPATFVETAAANLGLVLLFALLLAALVVGAWFLQWRAVVVALVAIVVSLAGATLVLSAAGATINAMVVAGLVVALAVILDDAVVDVEHAIHGLRQRRSNGNDPSAAEAYVAAVSEMRGALGYALFVILLVVVPILVIDGITGSFLRPFALAFAAAIVVSSLVALTVTPALGALLLRGEAEERTNGAIRSVQRRYRDALEAVIRRPAPVFIAAGVVVVLAIVALPTLGREVAPSFQERDLLVQVDAAPGTSQTAMNRVVTQATAELREVRGVERVGSHVGRAIMSDQVVNVSSGQLWVRIGRDADYEETISSVREVVDGYPGLSLDVDSYLNDQAAAALGTTEEPVGVRVFGPDLGELERQAEAVRNAIADVNGVVDPRVVTSPSEPTIEVTVNLDAAYEHGVRPGDVRRAAATLVNGLEVGNLFEDQKVFEVIVVGVSSMRHSLTSIQNLLIDTPDGDQVRLSELADIRIAPAPTVVNRSGISRYLDVVAGVQPGADVGRVLANVRSAVGGLGFPLEYHPEISTAWEDGQAALQRLLGVAFAAAIGIFLLLQAASGSWLLAVLSLVSLPVALVGGILAAWLAGTGLPLGALVGFIAVLALAARNQLVLGTRIRSLRGNGGGPLDSATVVEAARERFAPTLITAIATALAFVPILVLGPQPGLEVLYPMAVVVVGGLVTTTLLDLFIVPRLHLGLRATPGAEPIDVTAPQTVQPQPAGVL